MLKRPLSARPISRKTRIEILLSTIQDEAYLDVALTACSLVDINKELLLAKIFTASFDESDTRSFQKKIASIATSFLSEDKNARLKSRPYTLNSENSHMSSSPQSTLLSDEGEPDAKRKCKRSLVLSDTEDGEETESLLPIKETEKLFQLPLLLEDDTDDEELGDVNDDNEDRPEKPSPDHIWCEQCDAWKPSDSFSAEKQGLWLTRSHRKPSDEIFCLDHLTSHFIHCIKAKLQEPKKVQQVQEPKKNEPVQLDVGLSRDVYSFGARRMLCINGMALNRYYRNYDPSVSTRYMDEFRRTQSFEREDFLKMLPSGSDVSKFTEMETDRLRHFIIDMIVTSS